MSQVTKLIVLVLIITWVSGCATSATSYAESPEYCTVDYEAQLTEIRRIALVTTSEPTTIENVTAQRVELELQEKLQPLQVQIRTPSY